MSMFAKDKEDLYLAKHSVILWTAFGNIFALYNLSARFDLFCVHGRGIAVLSEVWGVLAADV